MLNKFVSKLILTEGTSGGYYFTDVLTGKLIIVTERLEVIQVG